MQTAKSRARVMTTFCKPLNFQDYMIIYGVDKPSKVHRTLCFAIVLVLKMIYTQLKQNVRYKLHKKNFIYKYLLVYQIDTGATKKDLNPNICN